MYEVFENVLSRHDFSVTGNTVGNLEKAVVEEQGTFDAFFDKNYDPINNINNNYQLSFLVSGQVQLTNTGTGTIIGSVDYTSGSPFAIEGMQFEATAAAGNTIEFSLDTPEKKSMAQTIHEFEAVLMQSNIDSDTLQEAISDALVGLDNGQEKLSLEHSSIGSRLNIAESMYESNLDMEIAAKASRSSIQDVDYAEASTEFAKQETALNAALTTFPQVSNLSLFNFI